MMRVICLLIGYFIGCIQTAFIVGKLMSDIDIREHGSGNAGTTNVMRTLGAKAGAIVFVSDILKGILAYIICSLIFDGAGTFTTGINGFIPGLYAGLGVILGHNFPFYLKFKGGKGTASSLGIFLCLDYRIAIISYLLAIISIAITRYISLASLIIVSSVTIMLYLAHYNMEIVIVSFLLVVLSSYKHKENILRLIKGTESKFTFRPKIKKDLKKRSD